MKLSHDEETKAPTVAQPRSGYVVQAAQAVQLRDNVLAIVAHDLKTPLATITMAAALLQDMAVDERSHHFLDIIVKSTQQIDVLIRDLVDVDRIEAGHLRVDVEPRRLSFLVDSVRELFEPQAQQAGVHLTCDGQSVHNFFVDVDQERCLQLLSNLVSNAIKFTPAGGEVSVRADVSSDVARVTVSDSGAGIAPDELPHVFERFWQADHHQRAGAGLGLAIAKGIAEAHGGSITVSSKPQQGATFCFTLPVSSNRAGARADMRYAALP